MYKVFISYSTKDFAVVEQVRGIIQSPSVGVFVAEYSVSAGQPLGENIVRGIRDCDLFLLIWSANSKDSEWVPQEIGLAKAAQKFILPLVLHPLDLPGFIKELKYLPAYEEANTALAWLRENIFERAEKKQKAEGAFWLSIGAALLWLISRG